MADVIVEAAPEPRRWRRALDGALEPLRTMHSAAMLTGFATALFVLLFGTLAVRNQENFGTWSYDMGIYDQGFWLVSRGGQTFMTVRGLDFWGHHFNLIAYAFAPFYWLGAGPKFLYAVQALFLGLGAVPTYLIARDRFNKPWMGLLFAVVYLMYAPIERISWAMFHPEAMVITPMLFAWWFATRRQWGWYFGMVLLALSMREDTALAVVMMGLVLLVYLRKRPDAKRSRKMALGTIALGLAWYYIATAVIIRHFNHGEAPFYIEFFYGNYGKTVPQIVGNMVRHPGRVIHDATRPDRLRFYRDLALPWGGLPLLSPLTLLMALPQMVASVIGLSPYARMIKYQYTSVMIAPITISAIEGTWLLWRFKVIRIVLPVWMLVWAYTTNVWWSVSPIGDSYWIWAKPSPRHDTMAEALAYVPKDATVAATYNLLPHLSQRTEIFDWPNPFIPSVWGNKNCDHLPDPTVVDYIAVDRTQVSPAQQSLFTEMLAFGGPFVRVFDKDDIVVARRVHTDPRVDVLPQQLTCPGVVHR